ncbi:hypothetical protein F5Y09DRAFT_202349 [Xylaria sp. FL1042]|nr:hypothetical protein F5Y09DRAFT_202349 [Xylaria sp. FL1042]
MQVDRTKKRREAQVGRRDGLKATVICAMSGQARAACRAGHAVGLRPVSLRPSWQPVRTAQSREGETRETTGWGQGCSWDGEGMGKWGICSAALDRRPGKGQEKQRKDSARVGRQWGSGGARWPGC